MKNKEVMQMLDMMESVPEEVGAATREEVKALGEQVEKTLAAFEETPPDREADSQKPEAPKRSLKKSPRKRMRMLVCLRQISNWLFAGIGTSSLSFSCSAAASSLTHSKSRIARTGSLSRSH